jgi:hypothetical protein
VKRGGAIKRKAKRRTPEEIAESLAWHMEVMRQTGDILTAGDTYPLVLHAHHIIPQQTLRRRAREIGVREGELLWDARNGVPMSPRRHERHHTGLEPLRWDELPERRRYYAQMFAVSYGLEPWLERHMPGYSR